MFWDVHKLIYVIYACCVFLVYTLQFIQYGTNIRFLTCNYFLIVVWSLTRTTFILDIWKHLFKIVICVLLKGIGYYNKILFILKLNLNITNTALKLTQFRNLYFQQMFNQQQTFTQSLLGSGQQNFQQMNSHIASINEQQNQFNIQVRNSFNQLYRQNWWGGRCPRSACCWWW